MNECIKDEGGRMKVGVGLETAKWMNECIKDEEGMMEAGVWLETAKWMKGWMFKGWKRKYEGRRGIRNCQMNEWMNI